MITHNLYFIALIFLKRNISKKEEGDDEMCKRANSQLDPVVIGERIKTALKECHKQQKELAIDMNVRTATVSRWVTGKTEPSSSNLQRIAEILDVTVDYLIGQDDTMSHPKKYLQHLKRFYERHPEVEQMLIQKQRFYRYLECLKEMGYDTEPILQDDNADEFTPGRGKFMKILYDIDEYVDLKGTKYLKRKDDIKNDDENKL